MLPPMPTPRRTYRWLAVLPALFIVLGVPFANRLHIVVLGLPFLLLWMLASVLMTSAIMALVYTLDRRHDAGAAPPRERP
jgi:hypothetical protein